MNTDSNAGTKMNGNKFMTIKDGVKKTRIVIEIKNLADD